MAAEKGLAKAFRQNNADAIQSYLSDDWAVIVAFGQVEEGKELSPSGIGLFSGPLERLMFQSPERAYLGIRVDHV